MAIGKIRNLGGVAKKKDLSFDYLTQTLSGDWSASGFASFSKTQGSITYAQNPGTATATCNLEREIDENCKLEISGFNNKTVNISVSVWAEGMGWTSVATTFSQASYPLSRYAGKSILLRFSVTYNGGTQNGGSLSILRIVQDK